MRQKLPSDGDRRTVERFLWFPKTLENERRWLERARWEERYLVGSFGRYWIAKRWLEGER